MKLGRAGVLQIRKSPTHAGIYSVNGKRLGLEELAKLLLSYWGSMSRRQTRRVQKWLEAERAEVGGYGIPRQWKRREEAGPCLWDWQTRSGQSKTRE